MKTKSGDPIGHYEGNCHVERKIDSNLTVLRSTKGAEALAPDEYYMRMNKSEDIAHGEKPDKIMGMPVVSKRYAYVWLPNHNVYVVKIEDRKKCFEMK